MGLQEVAIDAFRAHHLIWTIGWTIIVLLLLLRGDEFNVSSVKAREQYWATPLVLGAIKVNASPVLWHKRQDTRLSHSSTRGTLIWSTALSDATLDSHRWPRD